MTEIVFAPVLVRGVRNPKSESEKGQHGSSELLLPTFTYPTAISGTANARLNIDWTYT